MLVADPAAAAQAEKLAQLKAEEAEMQKKEAEREHGSREGAGGGGRTQQAAVWRRLGCAAGCHA